MDRNRILAAKIAELKPGIDEWGRTAKVLGPGEEFVVSLHIVNISVSGETEAVRGFAPLGRDLRPSGMHIEYLRPAKLTRQAREAILAVMPPGMKPAMHELLFTHKNQAVALKGIQREPINAPLVRQVGGIYRLAGEWVSSKRLTKRGFYQFVQIWEVKRKDHKA